jgi:phage terminase large subunit
MNQELVEKLRRWKRDPLQFAIECFNFVPDAWQADGLTLAGKPGRKRLLFKACAGPGKSAELAILGWHRLACFAEIGEHPKGAAVSVTADNLDSNLWAELAKWQNRSPFLLHIFQWTKTRIFCKENPETWFLSAKAFSKTADQEAVGRTLSGLHSKFPFYLIDESGDIPPQMAKSAEQGLSTCEDGLIVTAGNPTSQTGMLYNICSTNRGEWDIITITGDPDDPKRSPRVDLAWAKEQIEKYGRDNAWVQAYILGMFPPGGINTLFNLEEIEAASKLQYKEPDYAWSQKRLGIDVARFGDDRSVIYKRQGLILFDNPTIMRHQRTTDIAAQVAVLKTQWGSEMEFVDDTGHWGHGVIDNLFAAGYSPMGIQFHGPPIDPRYLNKRAEMYFGFSDWVKRGGALPPRASLRAEMAAMTYTFNNGKLQLEDKDLFKKRLGFSPDEADAAALTFAMPDMPAAMMNNIPGQTRGKMQSDFDPYQWD